MPVEQHDVHPSTRIDAGYRYGCHNRQRPAEDAGYWAPDRRHFPDGRWEMTQTQVPYRFSAECRNDVSLTDPHCTGCEHRGTGEAYTEKIRKEAAK